MGKTSLLYESVRQLKRYRMLYVDLLEIKTADDLCKRMIKGNPRDRSFIGGVNQTTDYRVKLIFLKLPTVDTAIERVATRVAQGGHAIPDGVIRRRFEAGWRNFTKLYRPLLDAWQVYDNAGDEPILLAEYLLREHGYAKLEQTDITDAENYLLKLPFLHIAADTSDVMVATDPREAEKLPMAQHGLDE